MGVLKLKSYSLIEGIWTLAKIMTIIRCNNSCQNQSQLYVQIWVEIKTTYEIAGSFDKIYVQFKTHSEDTVTY